MLKRTVQAHNSEIQLRCARLAAALCKDRPKEQPLLLGSVKANIGHAEAAAGMASLIKVILAFQNEQIPPQIHFKQPNPHIEWESLPVKVVDRLTDWKRGDTPRIAGINSFGISGTNSHLVLQEAPLREAPGAEAVERSFQILPFSANNENALHDLAGRYENYLRIMRMPLWKTLLIPPVWGEHSLLIVWQSSAIAPKISVKNSLGLPQTRMIKLSSWGAYAEQRNPSSPSCLPGRVHSTSIWPSNSMRPSQYFTRRWISAMSCCYPICHRHCFPFCIHPAMKKHRSTKRLIHNPHYFRLNMLWLSSGNPGALPRL